MSWAANGLNTIHAAGGGVGGWVEVGRTTLGSNATTITVSSLPDKRYYMILYNLIDDGTNTHILTTRMGNGSVDTGSNYAERGSSNGATDVTYTSSSYTNTGAGDAVVPEFDVMYLANRASNEKIWINQSVAAAADGAGTAPIRREQVGKWANTSNAMDVIQANTAFASRSYGTGSEVVVLGWDPADTHTNNFWEELADVTQGSADPTITSGTITAKKYLWVQAWLDPSTSTKIVENFNSDSGSNYSHRQSADGGTDTTTTSQTNALVRNNTLSTPYFVNQFIINNSSNEKLGISHVIGQNTAGAGTAPVRCESVQKWANTSNQITDIDLTTSAGNWNTGSRMKVWGAN